MHRLLHGLPGQGRRDAGPFRQGSRRSHDRAALADIAAALVETGVRRILVAGGETSGAVVSRLGVRALRIGETIAPGVPWTETLLNPAQPDAPHLALALKSGNFGGEDFFMQALGLLANAD